MISLLQTRPRTFWLIVAIIALTIVFRIWVSQPNWMHFDENYYINIAQNYAVRGELTPYMWRLGQVNIISGGGSGYGIILLNLWLRVVNYSLFWGRVFMVIVGVVTAFVVYKIAWLWWHVRAAGIAALIFALVATSSFYTMIVRMDSIGILADALVLLLHIYAVQSRKKWLHFIVGVAIVITLEFHVLGMLYLAALTLYYLISFISELVRKRRFVLNTPPVYFAIGGLLAGMIYIGIHVLPDPKAYFLISKSCFECGEGIFITESKRLLRFVFLRPYEAVIIVVFVAVALKRRRPEDYHFLILLAGWLLAEAAIGTPPYTHYTNHLWPLMALGVAGLFSGTSGSKIQKMSIPIGITVACLMLVTNLGMHLARFHPYILSYELQDSEALRYIHENIPYDAVIMGSIPSFYPLHEYLNYLSYHDGDSYGLELRGESTLDFWRRIQPKVILLNEIDVLKDNDLKQYMSEAHFVCVLPDLWIAEDLAKTAEAG